MGGSGQISGVGSVADSQELATLLKSGALPVKLTVETQKTVGPDMGADGVAAGQAGLHRRFCRCGYLYDHQLWSFWPCCKCGPDHQPYSDHGRA